ncbi:MAG: hypothetical protein ABI898_05055 [Sphingomonadales bacterium]
MINYTPRLFETDADIRRIGNGLLDCILPRADWTHEAHLAACLWLVRERPDIHLETKMRVIISRYNESVGGVNDDTQGYHDTITHCFIRVVKRYLADCAAGMSLADAVNGLLKSPFGRKNVPLTYYSRSRLFSVAARRGFILPDLVDLPEMG